MNFSGSFSKSPQWWCCTEVGSSRTPLSPSSWLQVIHRTRGTWINIQEGLIIFEIFTQYDPKLLLTWTSKTFRLKIMFTLKILLYSNCNLLWYNNTYLVISIRNYAYEFNWSTILGIYKFHFFPDDKRQDEKSHFMH